MSVATHEAAHCVSAWALGREIGRVHAFRHIALDGAYGEVRFEAPKNAGSALVYVAGEIAEKAEAGDRWPSFDWWDGSYDAIAAGEILEATGASARLIELKARALLFTRWKAVEAVADILREDKLSNGAEIDRICRGLGIRKAGQRGYNPDHHFVAVGDSQKRLTMRQWADTLALHGHDRQRAERALGKE